MSSRKTRPAYNVYFVAAVVLLAGLLRYEWIIAAHPWETLQQFQERYIYSDMFQYWQNAEKFWIPGAQWEYIDLLYPPGTGVWNALILGPQMSRVALWQWMQWLQSMVIFLGTGYLANLLYGRRASVIALFIAALAFPLFDYSAYMLSETPFMLFLLAAVICAALALKRKQSRWLFVAGLLFAVSATCKSLGLLAAALLMPMFFFPLWHKRLWIRLQGVTLFCAGLLSVLLPVVYVMTQRNGGQFMLFNHDIIRIATANYGRMLGTMALLPDGTYYRIGLPVGIQKNYQEMRPIDVVKSDVIAENWQWMRSHPLQATTDFIERMTDLVFGTLPFPTFATRFRSLLSLSQHLTLFCIYFPAAAWAIKLRSRFSKKERSTSLLIILPLSSLIVAAAIAATEPRYLHSFLPLLIVFASMFYKQLFGLSDTDGANRRVRA